MALPRFRVAGASALALLGSLAFASPAAAKLDLYNPKKLYGDEKKTIADPASRCTGPAFETALKDADARAEKDLAGYADASGNVKAGIADAYEAYVGELALARAAMREPYCGFGAFGATAARNSLKKTLDRARSRFLAAAKAAAPVPSVATADAPPASTAPVPRLPSAVLKRGDRGSGVDALQAILVRKGYLARDSATGFFGAETEKALVAFQKAKKLVTGPRSPGAGQTGPRTRDALSL